MGLGPIWNSEEQLASYQTVFIITLIRLHVILNFHYDSVDFFFWMLRCFGNFKITLDEDLAATQTSIQILYYQKLLSSLIIVYSTFNLKMKFICPVMLLIWSANHKLYQFHGKKCAKRVCKIDIINSEEE